MHCINYRTCICTLVRYVPVGIPTRYGIHVYIYLIPSTTSVTMVELCTVPHVGGLGPYTSCIIGDAIKT